MTTTTTCEARSVTIVSTDTLHGCATGSIDQIRYGLYCIDRTEQYTTKSPDVENTFDRIQHTHSHQTQEYHWYGALTLSAANDTAAGEEPIPVFWVIGNKLRMLPVFLLTQQWTFQSV